MQEEQEDWATYAACIGKPQEWFFYKQENSVSIQKAKAVCKDCPVREDCLTEGLIARINGYMVDGVWGGATLEERRRMRVFLGGRTLREAISDSPSSSSDLTAAVVELDEAVDG